MVRQYPYQLYVQVFLADSVQDENGNWTSLEASWDMISPCRDEANSAGASVTLEDSTAYRYDSLIQLPKSCPDLTQGTPIEVRDGDVVRLSGTVSRFRADQLHSRLWV